MENVEKAVVALEWTDKNNLLSGRCETTGFIYKSNDEGIFILSSAHQFDHKMFDNTTEIEFPKSQIGVKVTFFDHIDLKAEVLHISRGIDLTLIIVKSCDELKTYPLACIEPITFSMDPPNPNDSIYTFHHPVWTNNATGKKVNVHYHYSLGSIVSNFNRNSGFLNYSMPLVFPGSSGAPLLSKNSNKLVSMMLSYELLHNVPEIGEHPGTMWGEVHMLHTGPTVSSIQEFLNEANPSTTEGQSGDTGDSDDLLIDY